LLSRLAQASRRKKSRSFLLSRLAVLIKRRGFLLSRLSRLK
jgi:hypothetical protein